MTETTQPAAAPAPPTSSEPKPKRPIVYWADLMRVLAIYLVVMIHTSGQLTNVWGKIPDVQWIIANVYGGVARIGVPLFFMLSGFLLLPRSESLGSFYGKRMVKIVVPFIVWSAIYIGMDCAANPGKCTTDYLLQFILLKRTYFHLWFLYSLASIYFILPLMRLMVRPGTDSRLLWYLMLLWLIFQPVRTLMDQFLHFDININSQLAIGFLPYFFLGHLLGSVPLTRRVLTWAGIVFMLGCAITVIGTYLMTRAGGQFNGYFYDYMTIGVIPAAAGGFVLLRRLSDVGFLATDRTHTFMRWASGGVFGVYLVHVLILWGLDRLHVNSFMGFALWSIPLVVTLVFGITLVIVRLVQKIPGMGYILPG